MSKMTIERVERDELVSAAAEAAEYFSEDELVSAAASAAEYFSEDELEDHARQNPITHDDREAELFARRPRG